MSKLEPWPIGPQKAVSIASAISYMKEMRAICDTDDGFVPQVYDMAIIALHAQPANDPLTCKGCENQKHSPNRSGFSYEVCIRCKRHWPDRFARKPEGSENK